MIELLSLVQLLHAENSLHVEDLLHHSPISFPVAMKALPRVQNHMGPSIQPDAGKHKSRRHEKSRG